MIERNVVKFRLQELLSKSMYSPNMGQIADMLTTEVHAELTDKIKGDMFSEEDLKIVLGVVVARKLHIATIQKPQNSLGGFVFKEI